MYEYSEHTSQEEGLFDTQRHIDQCNAIAASLSLLLSHDELWQSLRHF
jgi:hypothetical protein